jgi:putative membrane protein
VRRSSSIAVAIAGMAWMSRSARAHVTAPPRPGELWSAWEFEPAVVIALALTAALYWRGLRVVWGRAGRGVGIQAWEAVCFLLGWLVTAICLVSPLHAWGSALFSAHMTQHELLMLVAAPLIVLGHPLAVFLLAMPAGLAQDLARWGNAGWWGRLVGVLSNAFVAWALHAVVLWGWHVPALFEATLRSDAVHALQHASFFFSAVLFWWAAMQGGRAIGYGAALLYMFTTALHSGVLGALITLTRTVWYPVYQTTAPQWGLTPLEDQQLGGLIMWIPAGLVYVVAGLAFLAGWMREADRRVQRWETAPRTDTGR